MPGNNFTPFAWYWLSDGGQIYSSASQTFVSSADSSYVAWLMTGNKPTRWPVDDNGAQTNASLQAVLARYGLYADAPSAIAGAILSLNAALDAITEAITSQYPQSEVDSWPQQLIEARIVAASQTPPAPSLLQAMVTAQNNPNVTLQSLATAVIAKATSYQTITAAIQALRYSAQASLAAATTVPAVVAALATAEASASTLATTLGI